ncbi:MAG: Hint domain-containing protein [Pseudomonadota bacterium]
MTRRTPPSQSLAVYRGRDFRVIDGANLGDGLSDMSELQPDDIYALTATARPGRVAVTMAGDGRMTIAPDTGWGCPGAALHLDCALLLMTPQGAQQEALVLVETDPQLEISATYLLPVATLSPNRTYALVSMTRAAREVFARIGTVSFTRGTRITRADGAQTPIEALSIGDRILTRDAGPQPIRWIGQSTTRATGATAPILIKAGTLNNAQDLRVSPDHRLFVYQRTDRIGAGTTEILVTARHLVNGDTIRVQEGGFVDYFQLLFDRHHLIYAEGIAAESMLITPRTRPVIPDTALRRLRARVPDPDDHGHTVDRAPLDRPDAAELLRRASRD